MVVVTLYLYYIKCVRLRLRFAAIHALDAKRSTSMIWNENKRGLQRSVAQIQYQWIIIMVLFLGIYGSGLYAAPISSLSHTHTLGVFSLRKDLYVCQWKPIRSVPIIRFGYNRFDLSFSASRTFQVTSTRCTEACGIVTMLLLLPLLQTLTHCYTLRSQLCSWCSNTRTELKLIRK